MGIFCPRIGTRKFKHLDTNVPNQLKEFNESAGVKVFSNKGKSKGKGKGKNKQK